MHSRLSSNIFQPFLFLFLSSKIALNLNQVSAFFSSRLRLSCYEDGAWKTRPIIDECEDSSVVVLGAI